MKIDIWSDIMCPFCYIAKRKLELALEQFDHKDKVSIHWHSFLLQPGIKYEEGKNIHDFLMESKGLSYERALKLTQHVKDTAKEVGLHFNFDKIVVANSFDAHRFTHFAAVHGYQNEAEEKLFKAYFVDGRNIGDHKVPKSVGKELGFKDWDLDDMLSSGKYSKEVNEDIYEARKLNIRGVPYFIFIRKYGISGAQPVNLFLQVLKKAYEDETKLIETSSSKGGSCINESCSF